MDIFLSQEAQERLDALGDAVRKEIVNAFRVLQKHPLSNSHTRFIDHPRYRKIYRYKCKQDHADHRIFFTITDDADECFIITLLHRDTAYDFEER